MSVGAAVIHADWLVLVSMWKAPTHISEDLMSLKFLSCEGVRLFDPKYCLACLFVSAFRWMIVYIAP
jgi:hypothetical protein